MKSSKIGTREWKKLFDMTTALLQADSHEKFVAMLVSQMHEMMGAAVTGYNETDVHAKHFTFLVHPREVVNDSMIAAWVNHASENPVLRHIQLHPEDLSVHKITDFSPIQQFRDTALCRKVYKPMNAEFQIVMPIIFEKTNVVVIVFNRAFDFTEQERQKLTLVQPLVTGVYKQFRRLESIAAASIEDSDSRSVVANNLRLTARLKEVLSLLVKGYSNAQIAKQLELSVRTVEKYVEQLLKLMEVRSRSAAVAKVLRIN